MRKNNNNTVVRFVLSSLIESYPAINLNERYDYFSCDNVRWPHTLESQKESVVDQFFTISFPNTNERCLLVCYLADVKKFRLSKTAASRVYLW